MTGKRLHSWSMPCNVAFPNFVPSHLTQNQDYWRRAVLLPNGDVLGIFEGIGVFRIDKNSQLLWSVRNGAHHDLDLLPNGNIVVITRKAHILERIHPTEPVLEDYLTMLSSDGQMLAEISLIECFENSRFVIRGLHEAKFSGDLFHTNGLQILTQSKPYHVPWMKPGLILVSMRHISALAVVDFDEKSIVQTLTGPYVWQHDPRVLDNGNLQVFDNRGLGQRSRLLELDPRDLSTVWEYHGSDGDPLFSDTCGMAERLPNGNTLITESDNGRAIEITPNGDIVWEFYNPHRAGEERQFIATLFELKRVAFDFCESWLGPQHN